MRLALGQLEDARQDPAGYRARMNSARPGSFGDTYMGALRQAIFLYHKTAQAGQAHTYLQHRLDRSKRLTSVSRRADTLDQLDWYTDEHQSRAWPTFQCALRLVVPLPAGPAGDLVCSGEIMRVDLVPSGGYAAWLMGSELILQWNTQLRFPIIQSALAGTLGVSIDNVSVGIYDFANRQIESRQYSEQEVRSARRAFNKLVRDLGF